MLVLQIVAIICFVLAFSGQFFAYGNGNKEGGRALALESAIWFVALVLCFK